MMPKIYTIGHSNLDFMRFLTLLQDNQISHIIDIRSIPYSRHAPWSNKSRLAEILKPFQIRYTYMGHKLGGKKPSQEKFNPSSTESTRIAYQNAVEDVRLRSESETLALLCAESDPANCHRQHVIAQSLMKMGTRVVHILKNGETKDAWLEDTLAEQPELF